jgi:hypothetical protein
MNHDKNVTTTVGHLIDGKIVADTASARSPSSTPPPASHHQRGAGQQGHGGGRHRLGRSRLPGLAQHAAAQARARDEQAESPARRKRRQDRRPDHRRARQGAGRRARRAAARHRERGIRQLRARAAQGRAQPQRGTQYRFVERIPAAGRHGGHHALQLSGHGAAVDVAHGRGLRQHLRAQALRARSDQRPVHCSAGAGSGPAARRAERGQRRQAGRGHAAAGPARQGRELRRVHAHRRIHLR